MARKVDRDDFEEIGKLYFKEHYSVNAIESEFNKKYTRTSIVNAVDVWKKSGRVKIEILPVDASQTRAEEEKALLHWQKRLTDEFELKACRLVHGVVYENGRDIDAAVTRVKMELGECAGKYLSDVIPALFPKKEKDKRTICVGAGSAVHYSIGQIVLEDNLEPDLVIIPTTGMLGWRRLSTSPIANARRLERVIGNARLHSYSVPAVIPKQTGINADQIKKSLELLRVVKAVDDLRKTAQMYILSVTDAPKIDEWSGDLLKLIDVETKERYKQLLKGEMKKNPPVGALSGIVFDKSGKEITEVPWVTTGISMTELCEAVKREATVILIGGGEEARNEAIFALLESKSINVLITDLKTARDLVHLSETEKHRTGTLRKKRTT